MPRGALLHRQPTAPAHDGKDLRVKPYSMFRVKIEGCQCGCVKLRHARSEGIYARVAGAGIGTFVIVKSLKLRRRIMESRVQLFGHALHPDFDRVSAWTVGDGGHLRYRLSCRREFSDDDSRLLDGRSRSDRGFSRWVVGLARLGCHTARHACETHRLAARHWQHRCASAVRRQLVVSPYGRPTQLRLCFRLRAPDWRS
jgi:hypothetical protein